jgi:hypothetical protein
MDQLIARAINFKDTKPNPKAAKAENKPDDKPDSKPDPKKDANTNGTKKCDYCDAPFRVEAKFKFKNYADQPEEWQRRKQSEIQYLKKRYQKQQQSDQQSTALANSPAYIVMNPNVGY